MTFGGAGDVTANGVIAGADVQLSKDGPGTLTLGGANTYTGTTTITEGTLRLGASNVIANTSNVVLNGGTLATGGISDTVGSLTVSASSVIDMGAGRIAVDLRKYRQLDGPVTGLELDGHD